MNGHIDEFNTYLTTVKRCSSNTLDAYMRDVKQFHSYCRMNGTNDIETVDQDYILKYVEYLKFLGKSDATKTRVIASLKAYFNFLASFGAIKDNPANLIKNPRNPKKLPTVLDSNDVLRLISQPKGNDYKSLRDKAMLELLYATGMRVSELIELQLNDVNAEIGIVTLRGKKERIIPIYPLAAKHLGEYIKNVRPALILNDEPNVLFLNMNGQALSRQGCWKIIKHYADLAGIKGDITPQTLRHCFATHLLENGAQLSDIKEMLGHSDISSTQVYAQILKSKYVQSYAKFHPLAK